METISKLFAELGFKVNTSGLKEFKDQMKAVSEGLKAQIQQSKLAISQSKEKEAAYKAETAQLRNLDLQQRMETRAARAADAQRARSLASLRSFALGISAVGYAMAKLTSQTRQHAMMYRDYMRFTGMSVQGLQKFEAVAAEVAPNLSGQQIAGELTNLQQNLTNIEFGQGNIFPYQLLGISATTKDATKIVEGLRNAIQGLSDARAVNLIGKMGLSKDWLYILRMSREEFEKITAVMLSKDQIEQVNRMSLAFNKLKFSLGNMRDQLVAFVSPVFDAFSTNLKIAADAISRFVKESESAKYVLGGLAVIAGGLAAAFAPVTATLAALYLILEDLYVGTHGGESLFDWDTSAWNAVMDFFRELRDILKEVYDIGSGIINFPKNIYNSVKAIAERQWEKIKEGWSWLPSAGSFAQRLNPFEGMMDGLYNVTSEMIGNRQIVNNINMSGYTPLEGSQFVGNLNNVQSTENNLTSSQMTTIGSAG